MRLATLAFLAVLAAGTSARLSKRGTSCSASIGRKVTAHNNPHHHANPITVTGNSTSSDASANGTVPNASAKKHRHKSSGKARLASSTRSSSPNPTAAASTSSATGLIAVTDATCGSTGATLTSTKDAGPNGAISFLNCGISKSDPSSGWTPPKIKMSQVIAKDLSECPDTLFSACKPYQSLFEKYGQANGIPPILLAAFASEESSCNPNASGDNGDAFGLMQITSDKCGNAPNGNCNDPDYNVSTGAKFFASLLEQFGGDVLQSLGNYNGWTYGLSYDQATAAANSGCCECQNNLDYLHQLLNGWANCIDGGTIANYDNLADCGGGN